jgi:hypothetical protein
MKRLIRLPLVLALGFLTIVAVIMYTIVMVLFELSDLVITATITKEKHKL